MKDLLNHIKKHPVLITALFLSTATILSFILSTIIPNDSANIALIYVLAAIMIARYTDGYWYDVFASVFSVICINFFFTYPHFELNFTITGYPIIFIVMMIITFSTSALTSHMKQQALILAKREKQLMEADKEKMRANLLRAVSHDLRTPLTSIIGSISSLIENEDSLSAKEKKEIEMHIYDDSNWLLTMVENLLTVTRIQNDSSTVNKSLEVVEEVVSEAVSRLKKRLPDANIQVNIPDDFLMIPIDAMLIEQVLMNLIENAIIHSQSTRPIEVIISSEEPVVKFSVIDHGIGINEEQIQSIFDGLPTTPSNTSDSKKGMGIGLSICKTIILAHNGSIYAKNHEDGAEFTFILPNKYERRFL